MHGPDAHGLTDEQEVRAWCEALHAALTKGPGIRSVRWYDRETFDRDHGETWFDAPSDRPLPW